MNKAFVKESDNDDDDAEALALAQAIPAGAKNYITPAGYKAIKDELLQLIDVDRPEVVKIVHWAASNGDRVSASIIRASAPLGSIARSSPQATNIGAAAAWIMPATPRSAAGQSAGRSGRRTGGGAFVTMSSRDRGDG